MIDLTFIIIDTVADSWADLYRDDLITKLYVYFIQDLALLFALMILLLKFFHENILRQRLLTTVIVANWHLIAIYLVNIIYTVSWQIIIYDRSSIKWRPTIVAYVFKRLISILYYFALRKPILEADQSVR